MGTQTTLDNAMYGQHDVRTALRQPIALRYNKKYISSEGEFAGLDFEFLKVKTEPGQIQLVVYNLADKSIRHFSQGTIETILIECKTLCGRVVLNEEEVVN